MYYCGIRPAPILVSPAPISYPALCYTSLRPLGPAAMSETRQSQTDIITACQRRPLKPAEFGHYPANEDRKSFDSIRLRVIFPEKRR